MCNADSCLISAISSWGKKHEEIMTEEVGDVLVMFCKVLDNLFHLQDYKTCL